MFKKTAMLFLALLGLQVQAMDATRDPYSYRDESTVRDKRSIAIIAYGSLVKNPAPNDRPALKIEGQFQSTDIALPVALSRKSRGNRITAVVDNDLGENKRVYYAKSEYQFLPNARNNLAAREGVPFTNSKYSLDNIFYMKKVGSRDSNERQIPGTDWLIRTDGGPRVVLNDIKATELARWADQKGFTAIVWASFPPTFSSTKDVAKALLNNSTLLTNTKSYVDILPDGPQTELEKAISNRDMNKLREISNR